MFIQEPDNFGKVGHGTGLRRLGNHCLVCLFVLVLTDTGIYIVVTEMQDAKAQGI